MSIQKQLIPRRVEQSLEQVKDEFNKNPFNFLVESSIQYRLTDILSDKYDSTSIQVDKENVTNYKSSYIDVFEDKNSINLVQAEVNLGKGEDHNDHLVDVCVFEECQDLSVKINNGSKYFDSDQIKTAIEMKYVKNNNMLGSIWNNDNAPENLEELKKIRKNSSDSKQFFKDIIKLSQLDTKNKILIVFSNKNILQQPPDSQNWKEEGEDNKNSKKAIEKLQNLLDILHQENIALREVHLEP